MYGYFTVHAHNQPIGLQWDIRQRQACTGLCCSL